MRLQISSFQSRWPKSHFLVATNQIEVFEVLFPSTLPRLPFSPSLPQLISFTGQNFAQFQVNPILH